MTKTFVATVVMQLVAERRVRLDDTVHRYLPGRLRAGRQIRIRQLLNHSSGIPDYMQYEPWISTVARNPRAVIPAKRLISSVAKLPLEYRPGSQASYSNTNYLVLGEILERVTHRPVAQAARAADLHAARARVNRLRERAAPASARPDARLRHHRLNAARRLAAQARRPWADGAIVSNARDLAVFFGALLRGRLVPPALVAQMRKVVPGSHGNGLGIFKLGSPCGRWFYGNTGGTPGYMTFAAGSQDGRRLFVFAVNGVDPRRMEAIAGRYLDDLLCRG